MYSQQWQNSNVMHFLMVILYFGGTDRGRSSLYPLSLVWEIPMQGFSVDCIGVRPVGEGFKTPPCPLLTTQEIKGHALAGKRVEQ